MRTYAAGTVAVLLAIFFAACGPRPDNGTQEEPGAESRAQQTQKKQEKKQAEQQSGRQETDGGGSGGYLGTVNKARRSAMKTAALTKLQKEIKRFRALKGRHPRSLDEFKKWRGGEMPKAPAGKRYTYDPDSGELKLAPAR